LLLSPALVFLGLTFRRQALPAALRNPARSSGVFAALIGGVIALASTGGVWTLASGTAFQLAGALVLTRLWTARHEWTESPPGPNPYNRYATIGALGLALFFVMAVFAKSGHSSKEAMIERAMRSDLRSLVSYQREALADSGRYLAQVDPSDALMFTGLTDLTVALTADGWTARLRRHTTGLECVVFVGSSPLAPATEPETPACTGQETHKPFLPNGVIYIVGLLVALTGVRPRGASRS
jgi:hypothetical protein